MAILTTYFNLIMANETRRFEQKFDKIAKALRRFDKLTAGRLRAGGSGGYATPT